MKIPKRYLIAFLLKNDLIPLQPQRIATYDILDLILKINTPYDSNTKTNYILANFVLSPVFFIFPRHLKKKFEILNMHYICEINDDLSNISTNTNAKTKKRNLFFRFIFY